MNISKSIQAGALGLAVISSINVAQADDDAGLYLGINVNRVSANFQDERDLDFRDSDNAYGVKAGYMFTDFIGLEVAYLDLGEFSAKGDGRRNRIELDADAYSFAVVGNWSVLDQLDLYGKAGAMNVTANSTSLVAGGILRQDEDTTEPFVTFGAEWDMGSFNLFSEYTVVDTDIRELSVDIASAGVKFEF